MEDELKTMTNFAARRRDRILKALVMAHNLRHNAELFQGVGVHHRKDKNPQAAAVAKSLINQGIKVRLYLARTMGIMHGWMMLRAYAWPWFAKDSSHDGRFWRDWLLPAYKLLEDRLLELSALVSTPDVHDELSKKISRERQH
ncbi:MAG TPA: hypothetical protein VFK06_14665 [Candidatus Angelobacter sp.]|nr:hypothetical protein [Candidatus Angelobacter sp.]